jgi:hypothetical protein
LKRRTTITIIAVSAAVVVAGIGTWSVTGSMDEALHVGGGKVVAAPTPVATPVDEQEASKVAAENAAKGVAVGAALAPDQAKAIGHYWQGSLLAYKMADGSQVLIARDQPLPDNVKADAGKKLAAKADASAATGDTYNALVVAEQKTLSYETGHTVEVVFNAYVGLAPAFETKGRVWITTALGGDAQFPSSANALAAARAKVGTTAEIIVGE